MPPKTNVGGLSDADLEALLGDGDDSDDAGEAGDGDAPEGGTGAAEGDDAGSGDAGAGASDDTDDFPDREAFLASLSPAQRKHYDAALDKANGNARRYREKLKSGAAPSPADMPAKAATAAGDAKTDAPVDVEAVKAQLRAELEAEFNSKREADQAAAEATRQLVAAGLQLPEEPKKRTAALRKALKLIDLDSADPDDVELAVSELQDTMPSLFGAKPPSRRTGKVGGPTSTQATKAKNPIEALFD